MTFAAGAAMPPGSQRFLAVILATIAGYVDCHALLSYRVFASFMSGNTTQSGMYAGQWNLGEAGHNLLPIPVFVLGIFLGTLLTHAGQQLPRLLGLAASLLAGALAAVHLALPGWSSIVILSLAMGVMNTTITRVGGQSIGLGYVTGTLNNLAQHLALALKDLPVPDALGPWDTHWRRAALLTGLWSAFFAGALLAALAAPHFDKQTLLPPIVALAAAAVASRA